MTKDERDSEEERVAVEPTLDLEADRMLDRYFADRSAEEAARRVIEKFRDTALPPAERPRAAPRPLTPAPRSRPSWLLRSLAPVLAGALLIMVARSALSPPKAALTVTAASAVAVDGKEGARTAAAGSIVKAAGAATLALGGLSVAMKPGCEILVASLPAADRGGFELRQAAGAATYHLESGGRSGLRILVPGGWIQVTGTAFRVTRGENVTGVAVGKGTVELHGATEVARIGAGHSAHLEATGALGPTRPFNAIADPELSGAARVGHGASQ